MNKLSISKSLLSIAFSAILLLACANAYSSSSSGPSKNPFEKYFNYDTFTLDNGLRVIVHEDRSAHAVAITTFIHVGAKEEPQGRSGFAHMFEHLLFKGTKKNPGEFMKRISDLGGNNMNAFTSNDLTGYFEVVPSSAVERALWLEADRMINTVASLTIEDVRTEVDIVKNEKGGSDNQPFGRSVYTSISAMWPSGHPYGHSVIGSIEDLEAATLEDVNDWHKKYYGANNTVLVLAGDIDLATAKELVTRHYAAMPAGEPLIKHTLNTVRRSTNTQHSMREVAPASQLIRHYTFPPIDTPEGMSANIAAQIIATGISSRLREEIVENEKLAAFAFGDTDPRELDTVFSIYAEPIDGISLDELSNAIDQVIENFVRTGPTLAEMKSYQGFVRSQLSRATSNIVSKAQYLGGAALVFNDPLFDIKKLEVVDQKKPKEIQAAAKKWLSVGYHEERLHAQDVIKVDATLKEILTPPEIQATTQKKVFTPNVFTLKNGIEVVHLYRPNTPNVTLSYEKNIGNSVISPQQRVISGVMQDYLRNSGAPGMSKIEYAAFRKLNGMDAYLAINSNITRGVLSVDRDRMKAALPVWADLIKQPRWSKDDLKDTIRLKVDDLKKRKKSTNDIAQRLIDEVFYDEDRALSFDDEISLVNEIDIDKLKAMHAGWFRPEGFKIFAAGDITLDDLKQTLNSELGNWTSNAEAIATVTPQFPAPRNKPLFVVIEEEDVTQSYIYALRRAEHKPRDPYREDLINTIIGGNFISRLNLNIREDKGWTYGIYSDFSVEETETIFEIQSEVTAENTVDVIREIISELEAIRTTKPITKDEAQATIESTAKGYPSTLSSNQAIIKELGRGYKHSGDYGYYDSYVQRLESTNVDELRARASDVVATNDLVWFISGDLSKFEQELRDSGIGDIIVYDQSGNRLR